MNNFNPEIGDYVRRKYEPVVKGIVEFFDESDTMCYLTLHNGTKNFRIFVDNLEHDWETKREQIIDELCQEK